MAQDPTPQAPHNRRADCAAGFEDARIADRQLGPEICGKHVDMRWIVIKRKYHYSRPVDLRNCGHDS